MENKFKEYLDSKGIKYEYVHDEYYPYVVVDDYDLRPYESEIKELFPDVEFVWDVIPKHRGD